MLLTHVQQVWTAVDPLGNRIVHPESDDGGASKAENLTSTPSNRVHFQHPARRTSLPRSRERIILIGTVGVRHRQSNSPDGSPTGGARLSSSVQGSLASAVLFK